MQLDGLTALVTGASRGIGRAIAVQFAREGADLAVSGRDEAGLASVCDIARGYGRSCVAIAADLALPGSARIIHERAKDALGPIGILVNNAGIGSSAHPAPLVDYDDDFWERVLYVNLTVPYLLSKYVLPDMLAAGRGRVINIASVNGKLPALHGAAYSASKHGLLGLTKTMAMETVKNGITVNAICPGPVNTRTNDLRNEYDSARLGLSLEAIEAVRTPLGRRLEPEEIAPLAVLLASDGAAAITGQSINVDGGGLMAA